ncbi:TIR domain-containing protein [Desulfitobacterium sp. AusDCA]|uniref:TIR domain-containing protein n=1 Tax=Desulfitobacterium sp. AusDCA TaxID=3240383 RepID=UPI003DA750C7
MIKAFLSHSSIDKDLVQLVHKKLSDGNAWYDAADIENGQSIPEKINEGLRHATHFVLFWSNNSSKSLWVKAELNAAFVRMMSNKCKFMIFTLDKTEMPELLQPYKYNSIDKSDLSNASEMVVKKIMSQDIAETRLTEFVNRTKEIGDMEESVRAGYKLIILNGILGIGKSTLAVNTLQWLYPNRAVNRFIIDFSMIPGIAELALELARQTQKELLNDNLTIEQQKENIQFFFEYVSGSNILLILKDVKNWLDEDGSLNDNLLFVTNLIVNTKMFSQVTIMTTSRYIELPYNYYENTRQIPIRGMSDLNISQIITNNLPTAFEVDERKNFEFAQRLYGYPLGAKLSAYRIANHGYDYYLTQPQKILELKVGLAKQLISFADISQECIEYLKIVALSQSRLRNEEYVIAFPHLQNNIARLADEAFFAGILKFDDSSCYKLELLVEDYFYDLAFSATNRNELCESLEKFLLQQVQDKHLDTARYMRLIPAAVHILTLNNKVKKALELRSELTATIESTMWDQYNHREYEESLKTANSLLDIDTDNIEALYVKALCLTRFEEYDESEKILNNLLSDDQGNSARYYYALGRIQKRQGKYNDAIELFQVAANRKRKYLSPYREMAECYMYMDKITNAKAAIEKAKQIDDSNIFVILLDARLLQKENRADEALKLLSNQSIMEQDPAQLLFRKGRTYDQIGKIEEAKQCYTKALEYNSKAFDARLCLLNHLILNNPQTSIDEIAVLKNELKGKRKFILMNIEARFIGYHEQDQDKALDLLNNVPHKYRDKQWYAVRIQLLENLAAKHSAAGRSIISKEYLKELETVRQMLEKAFGGKSIVESDFLPDA